MNCNHIHVYRRFMRRATIAYWQITIWCIDRLPWFARKPIFEWLFGGFHDFMLSDKVAAGMSLDGASLKW